MHTPFLVVSDYTCATASNVCSVAGLTPTKSNFINTLALPTGHFLAALGLSILDSGCAPSVGRPAVENGNPPPTCHK